MPITKVARADGEAYRVRVELPPWPDGRRRWHSEIVRGSKAAKAREAELLVQVRGGVEELGGRRLAAFLVDDWLPHYRGTVAASTYVQREKDVRLHIVPAFGDKRLVEMRPMALERWYRTLLDNGLKPATVRQIHSTLSTAYGQAERWGIVESNPMRRVTAPLPERAPQVVWSLEEIAAFIAGEQDPYWRTVWAVLAGTGMRRGEALALRWDDIEWERGVIRVERTHTRGDGGGPAVGRTKTASGRREVAIDPLLVTALRQHRARQLERRLLCGDGWRDEGWVFDRGDGGLAQRDTLYRAFRRRLRETGLPAATPHDLRHAHVTHLAAAGVPLATIAQRVGHAGVDVLLSVYTHLSGEHQGAAVEAISGVFSGLRDPNVTQTG